MLTLRFSPTSPFVRKVRIAADILGLADQIQLADADTMNSADSLRGQNPLGKIPALLLEDGTALFDSRVIVEYLDTLAGRTRLIPAGPERFAALTQQALADGLMDAALLQVYEVRYRPDESRREPAWVAYQADKVARALALMAERHAEAAEPLHVGHVAQACALGYLDLRFEGRWREAHPGLVAWLDDFAARVPAFAATRFQP